MNTKLQQMNTQTARIRNSQTVMWRQTTRLRIYLYDTWDWKCCQRKWEWGLRQVDVMLQHLESNNAKWYSSWTFTPINQFAFTTKPYRFRLAILIVFIVVWCGLCILVSLRIRFSTSRVYPHCPNKKLVKFVTFLEYTDGMTPLGSLIGTDSHNG